MKLNMTTDYATRILLYLANKSDIANSEEISFNSGISKQYVLKIMNTLVDSGMIDKRRGRKGGYFWGKHPEDISLYDIVLLLEGPCGIDEIAENAKDARGDTRPISYVHDFYNSLKQQIICELKSQTLDKIILNSKL